MKEFRSNNFSLNLFSDNPSLYLALKNKLESISEKETTRILRDIFRIFTRENLTTDYLSLKLVDDGIPSLLFDISPYRLIAKEFLKQTLTSDMILSDLTCVLIIESILVKEKKILANKKVLRQLAGDIFQFWKESLISYSVKEEKIPTDIREEYDSVIRKFIKSKGNRKIELEYLYEACSGGKSNFLSGEEVKEKFGEEILIYGVSEIDPLHFKILEILSAYTNISFLVSAPRLKLIQKDNSKLSELLPEWTILNRFLGDKKISEVEKILDFSFLFIPEDAKFSFYESHEAYREIEFTGREILRLVEENKRNDNFRLTSIKLVLPADDLNYSLLVSNVFDRMGIPHAFTKDIRKKKSPYFSAVISLLKLSISDFDKEAVFSLFYNPCFCPILEDMRIDVKPEVWNQIISKMNLSGFLDKQHKKNLGFRDSNLMTWESLWTRLNSILIGDTSQDSRILEATLLEEAYQFLEISSSLLQDLIGFKEDFSTLNDFSKFFRIILDVYLHPSIRFNEIEETKYQNERGQTKIYSLLTSIESIDAELNSVLRAKAHFTLEDFVDILLRLMDAWSGGDSRVLKNGVVVGELMDVIDPSFDFVYMVGMDERRFSNYSGKHDSVMIEDRHHSTRKDSALKLKNYFYHIFNHKAARYTFSYVSLDTIKDREYYPARELESIRSSLSAEDSEYKKIPLFSYLEYKMNLNSIFEKETFDLIGLKKKESDLPILKNSYPEWEENSDLSLAKEIDSLDTEKGLIKKIKTYFFRSSIDKEHSHLPQNMDLSVNRFVSYLECPKKFFYDYSVHTEEEQDTLGELESIDSLRRHVFIKEVLSYLKKDPRLNADQLIEKIFSTKRVESGEIPYGVLGKIAELDFKEYLTIHLLPFFYQSLSNRFAMEQNAVFHSEAGKTLESIVFSTPTIWNETMQANVDLLLLENDTLFLTFITSSKEISEKKQIIAGFTTHLINQSKQVKTELSAFFKKKEIHLRPGILHFPKNKAPVLKLGQSVGFQDGLFKSFRESLRENQYPAFPINADARICEYCPVNTICLGYQSGFKPFLEKEMTQIIDLSVGQFIS